MVSSSVKYAGTVSQVTGSVFAGWSDLANVKNGGTGYASTATVQAKGSNSSRPGTLTLTGFGFSLPVGADVTRVSVTFSHRHTGSCSVPAPSLSLVGVSGVAARKTFAPPSSFTPKTYNFFGAGLTRTVVNGAGFGVKLNYPANTSSGVGVVQLLYVRVTVYYKVSSYALGLKKVSGGFDGDDFVLEATVSNKNLTSYNPTLTLSAPAGFSFESSTGAGVVSRVNARTVTWNPKLSSKVGSRSVRFTFSTGVTFPSGVDTYTGTFSLVESLNSTAKSYVATINRRTTPSSSSAEDVDYYEAETTDSSRLFLGTEGEPLYFDYHLTNEEWSAIYESEQEGYPVTAGPTFKLTDVNSNLEIWSNGAYETANNHAITFDGTTHTCSMQLRSSNAGAYSLNVQAFYTVSVSNIPVEVTRDLSSFDVFFKPKEQYLSQPFFALIELGEEELDRLGDGYSYTVQTQLKHTTTDSYERDWYKNNRIGICNKELPTNPTNAQIFDNALYWSNAPTTPNSYNNLEAHFTYNKDYPVYILLTGDYNEATTYDYDTGTVTFTEPCIIETPSYKGPETNGTYPQPINELINLEDSNGLSTVTLEGYTNTNPVRAYNLPVEADFGTNDDLAIRGIQVRANIEQTDKLSINAKLVSPDGETGQRSTILNGDETELIIGGLGDLWGFNTTQLKQLTNWETELSISNLLSSEQSTILISDIEIHIWFENIEKQEITIKVEDENIAAYGAFIEKATIPEGLNTDTSYLTIDGTDTNDVYRQNIREKTITLEFNIDSCDLNTSTTLLRQLTKLLVNEKDQYNRPIPKKLQLSNYPDDIFEYIIEDTLDVENEVTGFNVKAKLVIPAGTSYTKDDIVTNTTGYVQGLAAINPIITLQPSDENIEIVEAITGQTFNIGYGGDWNDKVVVIDCEDRKVYLKTTEEEEDSIDISQYVDYSSDWFRLHGEYEFEGTNCTIRTVKYNERW